MGRAIFKERNQLLENPQVLRVAGILDDIKGDVAFYAREQRRQKPMPRESPGPSSTIVLNVVGRPLRCRIDRWRNQTE